MAGQGHVESTSGSAGLEISTDSERRGTPRQMFFVFAGVNVAVTNLAVGSLGITLGLSLLDVGLVYVLGGILGSAAVGLCVLIGKRTGASVMVNARPAFGYQGARLLALLLFLTTAGWFGVNTYFGLTATRSIVHELNVPEGRTTDFVLLLAMMAILVLIAVYGYDMIAKYDRVAVIVMTVALGTVAVGAVSNGVHFDYPAAVHGVQRFGMVALLATALGVGWGVSWTCFAHDFGRFIKRDASDASTFWMGAVGMYVGTLATFMLSALIATASPASFDVGVIVKSALPSGLALPILIAMSVGLLPACLVSLHVGPAVLDTIGFKLNRTQGVIATAIVGAPIAIIGIYQPDFGHTFKNWMLALTMWLTPWLVITLTDFFIIHRGRYSAEDLSLRTSSKSIFVPGIVAFLVSFAVSWFFANTPVYASPLMTDHLGGADISLFVGALVAFVIYYPWAALKRQRTVRSVSVHDSTIVEPGN